MSLTHQQFYHASSPLQKLQVAILRRRNPFKHKCFCSIQQFLRFKFFPHSRKLVSPRHIIVTDKIQTNQILINPASKLKKNVCFCCQMFDVFKHLSCVLQHFVHVFCKYFISLISIILTFIMLRDNSFFQTKKKVIEIKYQILVMRVNVL